MDTADARSLARSLKDLIEDAHRALVRDEQPELVTRVTGHLGCELKHVVNVVAAFPGWEHVNLQRGVDAYLAAHSPDAEWFVSAGQAREHAAYETMPAAVARGGEVTGPGAVDYAAVAIGPDETTEVVSLGLVLTRAPGGTPIVLALRGPQEHMSPNCQVVVLAPGRAAAKRARDRIERLMREHHVQRGQALSFAWRQHRRHGLVTLLPRPGVRA